MYVSLCCELEWFTAGGGALTGTLVLTERGGNVNKHRRH